MIRTVVVDDEKKHLDLNVELLEKHGEFSVVSSFRNPVNAEHEIRTIQPDLVCIDLMMPMLDGLELAQRIKSKSPDIRLVMISSSDSDLLPLKDCGIECFISKPLTDEKVKQIHELMIEE